MDASKFTENQKSEINDSSNNFSQDSKDCNNKELFELQESLRMVRIDDHPPTGKYASMIGGHNAPIFRQHSDCTWGVGPEKWTNMTCLSRLEEIKTKISALEKVKEMLCNSNTLSYNLDIDQIDLGSINEVTGNINQELNHD
jgi:hypothetical protein